MFCQAGSKGSLYSKIGSPQGGGGEYQVGGKNEEITASYKKPDKEEKVKKVYEN